MTECFVWPSDIDRAENEELARVCDRLEEVEDECDELRKCFYRACEELSAMKAELANEGEDVPIGPCISLITKLKSQHDALAAFAQEGISGLFESGMGWDADCIEEAAIAYGLIYGEPYDPDGKHANKQCEIIEPGDTLLQMQPWLSKAAQRGEQNEKRPVQE
ncbi:hypothetical protein L0636_01175 [Halomonas janggokensis]|uniref:Uncharacterized protein n=1 Tax=Vreelandella janggokensis TaxID=370767 RepID=A0ABT4IS52_9GAMM|nr:hypothetical protein [Halomonas janggokensis]MCZ0926500.1 hypothetical protein [Halomonas janggokensis]MCZ0929038.1 hypothetical protein [Halomonas janggokensis]